MQEFLYCCLLSIVRSSIYSSLSPLSRRGVCDPSHTDDQQRHQKPSHQQRRDNTAIHCQDPLSNPSTMSLWLKSARFAAAAAPRVVNRSMCGRHMSTLALTPPTFVPPPSFFVNSTLESLLSWSTWLIKRTFQPSIIRKRRKTGLLTRLKTVGGRNILKRRKIKGRARLAGC